MKCDACGTCCKYWFVKLEKQTSMLEKKRLEMRGIVVKSDRLIVYLPCKFLVDGKCSIYESRPVYCREFFCWKSKSWSELKELKNKV